MLLNLLVNAAKFMRDGLVTLEVKAKANGDMCQSHFAVIDTGMGMDLDQGTDIFAAFQQPQATSGSTGLGLLIAQRILVAMNSSLSVASTPGKGSRFSLCAGGAPDPCIRGGLDGVPAKQGGASRADTLVCSGWPDGGR